MQQNFFVWRFYPTWVIGYCYLLRSLDVCLTCLTKHRLSWGLIQHCLFTIMSPLKISCTWQIHFPIGADKKLIHVEAEAAYNLLLIQYKLATWKRSLALAIRCYCSLERCADFDLIWLRNLISFKYLNFEQRMFLLCLCGCL